MDLVEKKFINQKTEHKVEIVRCEIVQKYSRNCDSCRNKSEKMRIFMKLFKERKNAIKINTL